jgi:ribosomal protein S18 acetylase RimI-like enzyme
MASSVPVLRPAQATLEEGAAFARHLDTAADGIFRAMLGARWATILAHAFLEPGHDLSHQRVTFAERNDRIVGMVSGYTADEHRRSSDEPLTQAAGPLATARMAVFTVLGQPLLRFIERVPEGDFYLQAVAVDDDQRGHGIGSLLIDHAEAQAKRSGCRRLALDVAAKNDGARRLYERRGMVVKAESPHPPFMPRMRALRMVKPV